MQKKIDILGVKIDNLTVEELKQAVIEFASSKLPKTIVYANTKNINIAQKDKKYQEMLNSADLLHSDGWGVIWASKFLKKQLKEKIVITDFFVEFCEELAKRKIALFFLGGEPHIAKKAAQRLKQKIPALKIVGENHGFFDQDDKTILAKINDCRPDILIVGMGTPKQEKWVFYNRGLLNAPLCWSVGGLFDFISGKVRRAPLWMLRCHLEWLHRLCQEPRRLWKRYLVGNLIFIYRILRSGLRSR